MVARILPKEPGTLSHPERFGNGFHGRSDDGMDELQKFLETVRQQRLASGHLRGLFHVVIGRRITKLDGTLVSAGVTWRELAAKLKDLRFDTEIASEFDADPNEVAPRDRQRFWYAVIALARPDSAESFADADILAARLKPLGYLVASSSTAPSAARPKSPPQVPPSSRSSKGKKK